MMDPTTNILLIHSDQHRFDCLGVNGHPLLKTPNIDRLAAEGMNFTSAYCPIPLCVPSRNCLMHGQWPTQHLAIANYGTEAPRPPSGGLPAFSQVLREAGRFMGCVGKWDVNRDRGPLEFGFDEYVPDTEAPGKDYNSWRAERGLPPQPSGSGPYGLFGGPDPGIRPEETRLAWGADHVIRMIETYGQRRSPFFVRWDPSEPHLPCVVPEPYYSMYAPETIQPWASFPDPLAGKPYIQAQQRRTWKIEHYTWEDWAPIVSRYLAQIALLDAQIGRILDALDRLGMTGNTMVVYTTDHGDMCGAHGMIDKHYILYDDVVRVPLVVRWPGRVKPGSRCDAFVSHSIDLASTFCEVAGTGVPETFQGESLVPLLAGQQDNGRTDIFATYHGNQFGLYSQRMVRGRRWKYIWNATAEDELYDLQSDPAELHNLAAQVDHRAELAGLRKRLVEWMEETGDPLLNMWTRAQLLEGLTV